MMMMIDERSRITDGLCQSGDCGSEFVIYQTRLRQRRGNRY